MVGSGVPCFIFPSGLFPRSSIHSVTASFWVNQISLTLIYILDWDDFQKIPGCMTGTCTDIKDLGKRFLGGTDLREQAEGEKLKSIDDFNKAQSAGGAEAAPVLERLRNVLFEVGIDKELFDQVVDGMKKEYSGSTSNESELLSAVSEELGE